MFHHIRSFAGSAWCSMLEPAPVQFRYLQIYLIAAIACNLLLLFFEGYGGDLGYWKSWVSQLERNGYKDFNGNYPPLYIHWLYLVAKFYAWVDVPIEANNLLKYCAQIPVLV
ncbi:MAG TPA: hypothetical protein VIC26_04845, partial [Marinagarivorans sp.]